MARLSVALICQNEEQHIPAWLQSVKQVADEIVAVDSGSTDNTAALLEAAGVRVEHRDWTGYSDQRNYLTSLCTGDWILFLDADERVDAEMAGTMARFKQNPPNDADVYELPFKIFFFGSLLRHGGFFPEYTRRLMRAGKASWVGRQVHEDLECPGPIKKFSGPGYFEHHSYQTVGQYLRRMERYTLEAAGQMHLEGKKAAPFTAWSHGAWTFLSRYIVRGGFLDGWAGYLTARLEGLYTFTKYARLVEMNRNPQEKK